MSESTVRNGLKTSRLITHLKRR